MPFYRIDFATALTGLLITSVMLYGCATSKDSVNGPANNRKSPTGLPVSEQSTEPLPPATVIDARPAALLSGRSITWSELRPYLAEVAGGLALEEVILERQIRLALADGGLLITDQSLRQEETRLLESLSDDPDRAQLILRELRDRQALGEYRFRRLLWRNAALRALVADQVRVNEESLRRLHEILHGEKRIARVITRNTLAEAYQAMNRVTMGDSFIDVAVELSTDLSASRGGLLEPIARNDPAYPESIRETLWKLRSGELSAPILLDDRYALLRLERIIPADSILFEDARSDLTRLAQTNQQRLLMDELARRMLKEAAVTVYDDGLNSSWQRHRRRAAESR